MAEDKESKMKSLDLALEQIQKEYGKGAIMKLGDKPILKLASISTGSISLDAALGIGGVPRGRILEIYGQESSGKTTICLHIIAEAQKNGGLAAFIDTEHALDTGYAQKLGVDVNNLLISQPEYGEQALEICETLVRSNSLDVIVVDSVAALTPRAEIEGEMGDAVMGMQARLMSQALRKLTAAVSKSNVVLIFTNQMREKIGIMFGDPNTTTGGKALKFYASVRMEIKRIAAIKDGTDVIGNRTRVKVVKNKVAPPFKEVEFDIIYNEGISKIGDLIDMAVNKEIIKKSGAWFAYDDNRMQGRDGVKKFMQEDRKTLMKLYAEVKKSLGITDDAEEPTNGKAPLAETVTADEDSSSKKK
ncbi:MAG TPA: recombinase RecA [Ignavibacteria bacterium]|nr:recombinase RecA [Ignavibacteria bacterium]HQY52231.1 recombinase RecA [Ignavibacteria bacterium]HRA98811.1 recombinase RecA [Ignavibacteria bacterium]